LYERKINLLKSCALNLINLSKLKVNFKKDYIKLTNILDYSKRRNNMHYQIFYIYSDIIYIVFFL